MQYPYTYTPKAISIFFNGKSHNIPSDSKNFDKLCEHLLYEPHDPELITSLIDRGLAMSKFAEGSDVIVDLEAQTITYKGEELHGVLVDKMLDLAGEDADIEPLANFLRNIDQNPSYNSRQSLFAFLEHWMAPITEDGHFVAFKNVRENYHDIYSNTLDNSPGKVCEVSRHQVDDNINNTCSQGLHVAATSYLSHFYSNGSRTVAVKVNPADVVAVPPDYGNAKMRCCRYEVLEEVEPNSLEERSTRVVYDRDYDQAPSHRAFRV